jgi:hypothetical protein
MSADAQHERDGLEIAADQVIAACAGDMRERIKALIVENDYSESEVSELIKAVSHGYAREVLPLQRLVTRSLPSGRNEHLVSGRP